MNYMVLEKGKTFTRAIVFVRDENNHNSVADIFEVDHGNEDDLWVAIYEKFPKMNAVGFSGNVQESDCLTLREAAEASMKNLDY